MNEGGGEMFIKKNKDF